MFAQVGIKFTCSVLAKNMCHLGFKYINRCMEHIIPSLMAHMPFWGHPVTKLVFNTVSCKRIDDIHSERHQKAKK